MTATFDHSRGWLRRSVVGVLVGALSACAPAAPRPSAVAPTGALEIAQQAGIDTGTSLDALCRDHFADVPSAEGRLVGLMTDSGSVNDQTFNQLAYEGMLAAARCFGFDTTYVASGHDQDYSLHMQGLVDDGVEAVVAVGYALVPTTVEVAAANPDTLFIGVDHAAEDAPSNVAQVLYRDDQGGFLAGAAAAMTTATGVLGVVGGPEDNPAVRALVDGFVAGAARVDPEVRVLTAHVASFSDPASGAAAALDLTAAGADVVYGPAGLTGTGAILAAAQQGHWVIGVDQDQYLTTFEGGVVPGADRIVTSSVKRVDLGVFLHLADVAQGTFTGAATVLDVASGGVTYAPSHDADVSPDVLVRLEDVRRALGAGRLLLGGEPEGADAT